MPLLFNSILREHHLDPARVRLVRHKDQRSSPGRSPYELWRNDRKGFDNYQSTQRIRNRKIFSAPFWSVFLCDAFDETVFVGLYAAAWSGVLDHDQPMPHRIGDVDRAGSCDIYHLDLDDRMQDLIGRLIIDWGPGQRAWVQYADRREKQILEIRRVESSPPYPGHLNFVQPLSSIGKLPVGWIEALSAARGVYILTCPRTKEQYVGSADGPSGFWGRWMEYFKTGHGGNVGLRSRDPSDYQVAILEVAGSAADHDQILTMEGRWQLKLRSREMGLNRNVAKSS
ncbi:MAG: GIY-YIG nuclease family protein [Planctomycetaceae bacterium]|nr:GIY-YIG nuclease family protein [Planctomycetaceae bacterium]